MTERWFRALNKNQVVAVLLIDFKKAFDSVSHPILMKKLSACGVTGDLHCYLKSYLTSRKQFTKLNDVLSDEIAVEYGVPQGSLIGPTGFSLNVNDMAETTCVAGMMPTILRKVNWISLLMIPQPMRWEILSTKH